jgi:hypothetical protein
MAAKKETNQNDKHSSCRSIFKEGDTYEVFHDLMEGKGDFREDMEFLGEDS